MVMDTFISVILLFVGIAGLVLVHVCILGRPLNRANNDQGVNLVQRSSIFGIKRMSNEELNMLPCFNYTAEEKGTTTNPVDCAVCLESFKGGERCRLLPNCKHSFHAQCIDSWLLKTSVCPVCQTCAKTPKIDVSLGGESSVSGDCLNSVEGRLLYVLVSMLIVMFL